MRNAYHFGLMASEKIDDSHEQEKHVQMDRNQSSSLDDADSNAIHEWIYLDWNNEDTGPVDNDHQLPLRLSCFAHTLQLSIRDGIHDIVHLSKPLMKCIKLAQRSNKCTQIAELLDDIGKALSRSNTTRWSSEYMLIKSVIALGKEVVDDITDLIDDDELKFSSTDFLVLREAVEVLEPFADITRRIQAESAVNVSLVVPSIVHLIDHLHVMLSHVVWLKSMCLQLEASIHKRFAGIIKRLSQQHVETTDPFSDPIYFLSAVLDPEFKFLWLTQMNYQPMVESPMKQSLVQMILSECELLSYVSSSIQDENQHTTKPVEAVVLKKRKLFEYEDIVPTSMNTTNNPLQEINAYINDPMRSRFSSYWRNARLPALQQIVRRIFSVQASSAPIERVFSQAGLIMSARRTTMLDEVFRSLVFLRANQSLI